MSCNTAVLLIFFNRPDELKETFAAIRDAQPKRIYLAQDGAREDHPEDVNNILACRKIVENIDWDCQVFRRYSDVNQGCGRGPYHAINWVFEKEESAIILEDDCIASPSFFTFCDEMLERYWDDKRIFLITGCNFELVSQDVPYSYFFGHSGTNCGWATWKRNWALMDYECSWVKDRYVNENFMQYLNQLMIKRKARSEIESMHETNRRLAAGENLSYWDVQWQVIRHLNHQISIIPSKNLITNIGLGVTSTHAKDARVPDKYYEKIGDIHFCYNQRYNLEFPLRHPMTIQRNIEYDRKVDMKLYPPLYLRAWQRLRRIIKR